MCARQQTIMKTKNVNPNCEIDIDSPQFVKKSGTSTFYILQNENEMPELQMVQKFDNYELAYKWVKSERLRLRPEYVNIQIQSKKPYTEKLGKKLYEKICGHLELGTIVYLSFKNIDNDKCTHEFLEVSIGGAFADYPKQAKELLKITNIEDNLLSEKITSVMRMRDNN